MDKETTEFGTQRQHTEVEARTAQAQRSHLLKLTVFFSIRPNIFFPRLPTLIGVGVIREPSRERIDAESSASWVSMKRKTINVLNI